MVMMSYHYSFDIHPLEQNSGMGKILYFPKETTIYETGQ